MSRLVHKLLAAALLVGALAALPVSAGEISPLHRRSVVALLMANRGFPTRFQFIRTGDPDDTNRVLTEIASDSQADTVLQLNAIRALEYFPTRRTEEVLMTQLYTRGQSSLNKRTIMRCLARTFGVKMYFEIVPFLHEPDPRVRAGAALALAEIDDGRVRSLLTNLLENEPEISVRQSIEQGLTLVEAREKASAKDTRPVGSDLDEPRPDRIYGNEGERPLRPRRADGSQ
jgi:hypothetical protein